MKPFIEYLKEQVDFLEDLVSELENGEGDESPTILYIELDRLNAWFNGTTEVLPE